MRYLVTGGAGFIGSNLVSRFMDNGDKVAILDNLSRPRGGSDRNLEWLRGKCNSGSYKEIKFYGVDIEDYSRVSDVVSVFRPEVIIHCAAQTSLRRYIDNPYEDFLTNALGTLNILQASRGLGSHVIFLSTNKVYGDLRELPVVESTTRYSFSSIFGVSETQKLKTHLDPYSLSKTVGDLYSQLYLDTTVLRLSSIYGPRQWPILGQGWIGVFSSSVIKGEEIVVSGNGKQVRDILYVDDLVNLIESIASKRVVGVFNVGGGVSNSLSILELFEFLVEMGFGNPKVSYEDWNPWTQKVYISDNSKISKEIGWKPKVAMGKGIERYIGQWLLPEVLQQGLSP